ncbi:hypothetical protein [Hyphomonas sp. CY54-11-8]|uniref:hypothetical protein n=1 Tax=Hyphomonas sp. CY54-11-8 TaxID=1280944 RepID=UPI0004590925|nr:hypothetical protein [Hyphomonas sp. CY54-11-8]KCZ47729.1 hypothetical protein HY17_04435 [Hyphomonas sp. CY54-11-8]
MTPEQLEEIEARAKAATTERGGDWFAFQCQYRWHGSKPIFEDGTWFIQWSSEPETMPVATVDFGDDHDEPTRESACHIAKHIAGMDPTTTLALTAALRKAWEELDKALYINETGVERMRTMLSHAGVWVDPILLSSAVGLYLETVTRALKEPTHDQD